MTRNPQKTAILMGLLIVGMALTVYLAGAGPYSLDFKAVPGPEPAPAPWTETGMAVFFTDPTRESFRDGPENDLIAAIDGAQIQVDVAAYDLNLWGLRDALLAAHRRGVAVRLVVEADHLAGAEIQALVSAGIPVEGDRPNGLMHNKFVVIDRRQVWTGSMNFTLNGAYRNDNHLVAITNAAAAGAYQREFEEMFVEALFGAYSPVGEPTMVRVDGSGDRETQVEIYFSPDDGAAGRIIELLDGAQSSVQFMVFSFTSDEIGRSMLAASGRGVLVQGVFDESQLRSNRGSEYERLLGGGLDVRIDGSPFKLHHKVIIIDRRIVILGSYNFSASAESRNDENMLVVADETVAALFLQEWERVFNGGR